ncbi:helix-turn-helix transcriptional regulator [Paenibacillus sp. FSL H8-0537]|uniref:helix-turn-helix transcriptional regulator n=1 Tax=Paenibacillus sp. FSL H8-0537 TaxID=2921399 RepID=UPI003101630B
MSLSIGLSLEELPPEERFTKQDDLFREIAYRWLREVPDESLQALVEAASLVRSFDQELLEWMLGSAIESSLFRKLIDLSFIRPSHGGYYIHALLGKALSREIRSRTPKRYSRLWQRSIAYYHREIMNNFSELDLTETIASLMYGLGDSILLSTFFEEAPYEGYEYETVSEGNLRLVEDYIEDVLKTEANYVRSYYDLQSGEAHSMEISAEHDRVAFSHLEPAKLITLGTDVIRMIKNQDGLTIGLAVFIPIHRDSLDYLQALPVSRHYFATLNEQQLKPYHSAPDQPAGWYIYHIDLRKDSGIPSRTALMHLLLSLLMKQGIILFSSPLPYHQEITKRMGFHQVEGATHFDFGPQLPSPTFLLDLRGEKQRKYFDQLLQQVGVSSAPSLPEGIFGFTSKEREVALLVISTKSIAEIFESLRVTQVTVKKHLGRIYKKAEVRGKTQLLKKLMEAVHGR